MKKTFITALIIAMGITAHAQQPFVGKYINKEYKVYFQIDFVNKNVIVPDLEIFGELDGYIGCTQCNTIWPITSSTVHGKSAHIEVVNNYGSEDFEASVKVVNDSTLVYEHKGGSTLKFPVNKKWHKIPTKLTFLKVK